MTPEAVQNSTTAPFTKTRTVRSALVAALLIAAAALAVTESTFTGDTYYYVHEIRRVVQGERPPAALFEFGHLIWRPIGFTLSRAIYSDLDTQPLQVQRNRITGVMKYVSILATLACLFFLWLLMMEAAGASPPAAALACFGFASTNSLIQLSRAGASWIPGLAFILAACWFSFRGAQRKNTRLIVTAAICYAFAVMMWVPYLLTGLFIFWTGRLVRDEEPSWKDLMFRGVLLFGVAALVTAGAYLAAALANGITSIPEWLAWVKAATHGDGRDRQLLRLGFGLPRSFAIMGDYGVLWKQYLFRDPFAGVTLGEVLQSGAAVAFFYVACGVLAAGLWLSRRGRLLFVWAIWTVIPTLALALLFEAGSIERYLALYPAVFVCLAYVLTPGSAPRLVRYALMFAAAVLIGCNTYLAARPRVESYITQTARRVAGFRPADIVGVLNVRDPLSAVFYGRNEHPAAAGIPPIVTVLPSLPTDAARWQQVFAAQAVACWDRGGSVWVTKRLWAERPRRDWLWVEGDGPNERWDVFRKYFSGLKIEGEAGGPDGFYRIANTQANRDALEPLAVEEPAPQP